MPEKSVLIIGAGLAGLSAGCYARMNGYQARILEHHSRPGGVVSGWKRNGFLMDGGIHFLMDYKPPRVTSRLYAELGILPVNRVQPMDSYLRFLDGPSGKNIVITADLDRLAKDLKALFPSEAAIIDDLVSAARGMQGLDMMDIGLSKPAELTGWLEKISQLWRMRRWLKYLGGRYGRSVKDYAKEISDPALKRLMENLFLPDVPVFFVAMLLACLADGQMGMLEDGSLKFAQSLEDKYRSLGGQIDYSSTVTQIIVEDNLATGVQLENGKQFEADVIISAADGYSTIFQMLDGKYVSQRILDRYKNWKMFTPVMIVNFGLAREFKNEPSISVLALNQPFKIGVREVGLMTLRLFNHSPSFAPAGKTVIQVMVETDWDYWHNLRVNNRLEYDAEKQRVAEEVLKRLETHYPGISAQVEVTDVATPYTMWRYTHNYKGAWEGWLPTPETFKSPVRMTLPGLGNFYMAGQWVMPGGGVPPCLYSGRQVIQLLCHKDKKPFSPPEAGKSGG